MRDYIHNELLVIITNYACSLKCRDCANFIYKIPPELKKLFIKPDQLKEDLRKLSAVLRTNRIQIQGGEAMLHKELDQLIDIVHDCGISPNIQLVTNATHELEKHVIDSLIRNKINVRISNYGNEKQNILLWESVLKSNSIEYSQYKYASGDDLWYDMGEYNIKRNDNDTEVQNIFSTCPFKVCWTLFNGKLTKCSRSSSAYISGHHEYFERDFIDIRNGAPDLLRINISKMLQNEFMESCRYCKGVTGRKITPGIQLDKDKSSISSKNNKIKAAFFFSLSFQLRVLEPIAGEFEETLITNDIKELEEWSPEVIFTADSAQIPYLREISDRKNIILIGLRHGIANKYIPPEKEYSLADYVCGSNWDKDDFYASGVRPRKDFLITGNPWVDGIFKIPKRKINKENPTILFAPTYNPEVSAAVFFKGELVPLIRKVYPKSKIIIKPHPAIIDNDHHYVSMHQDLFKKLIDIWEKDTKFDKNTKFINDSKVAISDFYSEADILISDGSSLIFEFMALNRPILLFTSDNKIEIWKDVYDNSALANSKRNVGIEFKTKEDFIKALANAFDLHEKNHSKYQQEYTQEILGEFSDGLSYKRVAESVKSIIINNFSSKGRSNTSSFNSVTEISEKDVTKETTQQNTSPCNVIAFYLPQYHPIPENDQWWGKGFTEWSNVTKAKPLFPGHYQPHLPADLGFYDLRLREAREAQAKLAEQYGISGFCYYHYWFNGKRLLNRVFDEVLISGKPDFPFCLCWANEDWTRAWDGRDSNILMKQQYSQKDDMEHIKWLIHAFKDPRYIKIQGKPLLLIYRASDLPDPKNTADLWKEEVIRAGFPGLYLCRVESFPNEHSAPVTIGFNASVEFQPDWTNIGVKSNRYKDLNVFDYSEIVNRMINKPDPGYLRFPCVTPTWDNSPRKGMDGYIFHNSRPEYYEKWLRHALTIADKNSPEEKIVFINAWNEWGEGNHLEPDQRSGHAYLHATRRALTVESKDYHLNEELTCNASKALNTGNFEKAEQLLIEALSYDPEAPLTLHQSAILKFQLGKLNEGIELLEKAMSITPANSEIINDLATLYYQKGEKEKACNLFQKAIEIDNTQIDARKNLADIYFQSKRFIEAEKLYKDILSQYPNDTEALNSLTSIYKNMEGNDDASYLNNQTDDNLIAQPNNKSFSPKGVNLKSDEIECCNSIKSGLCNICGSKKGFLLTNPENPRESWVCQSCGSTSRDRMYIYALSSTFKNTSPLIDWVKNFSISVLEASGARAHPGILRLKFNYLNTKYVPEKMLDPNYDRKLYADLQELHYDDDSFNVVMSSDVFEHIRLHIKALKEIYRVLKPGGVMILQAPFHPENKENIIKVKPEGDKDIYLCPPIYHDEDTLVYRVYGAELLNEIKSVGFIAQAIEDEIPEYCITRQNIILAQKPLPSAITSQGNDIEQVTQLSNRVMPINSAKLDSSKTPLASIIIPVFNQVVYTSQCLEALKKHTPEDLYEIIIVDNNSTDGTQKYLAEFGDKIKIITNKKNQGFTIACNQGARKALGKYIVFLNNDTIPLDGWLTALLDTFKLSDDIGAVGSKLVYPDLSLQEAGGIVFCDGNGWNFGKGDLADHGRYNKIIEVDYCSGASLAVRKDIFDLIGGFDELYAPAYYEDTDFCFSIREKGYRVLYQPESEVIHCEGKTAGTSTDGGFKKYQLINKDKFSIKWAHRLIEQGPSPYEGAPKPYTADRIRRLAGYAHNKHINNFESEQTIGVDEQINFLVVDPFLPIYDRASGSFRLFQIVKILANTPNVHITYIARSGQHGEKYIDELTSLGIEVYHTDPEKLFPYNILGYRHQINLKYILSQRHYHYAFLSFYEIALQYLPDIRLFSPQTRVIVDTVDIHFVREMRHAELYKDEEMKIKALNTKKNETSIYQKADALITVTEEDTAAIRPYFPDRPIYIIPNIHPLEQYSKPFKKRKGIIFIGNFHHPPNIDAVEFYLNEIHPILQEKNTSIPVTIIGDGLPEHVKSNSKYLKNITFTGWVQETKPYLEHARISIAPLRYGAGMKGKIGESLASGLPVVTTSIGAEGIGLTQNQDVLIADSANEFAEMINKLYQDAELWEKLSVNGLQYIEQNYSPDAVQNKIKEIFKLPSHVISSPHNEQHLKLKNSLTSIIILCFNQLEYTKKCLESISKYTSVPYELIIIDNGSTDSTRAYLENYSKKHNECKIIFNHENSGFAAGNNQGIAVAKGEYILLLNNDVVVTEMWLERLITHIKSDANIGMVGPVSNFVSGPQLIKKTGYGHDMGLMQVFAQQHSKFHAGVNQDILRLVGFCILIKKQVLDIIGGLDENYGNGNYEDDDICLRSRIAGFRNVFAHDVFIHHYGSMTFKGNKINYNKSMDANRERFYNKWKDIITGKDDFYKVCLTKEQQVNKILEWGEEHFSKGNLSAALKTFERALKIDPSNAQALNNLGVMQWQLGDPAAAIKTFQNALTKDPYDADALQNLAETVLETGKYDLVSPDLLERLRQVQPENQVLETLFSGQQKLSQTK